MTTRIITGSKEEIARRVASLDGDVREAIVFIEDPNDAALQSGSNAGDLFAEMEPYTVRVADFDDSRNAAYRRLEEE